MMMGKETQSVTAAVGVIIIGKAFLNIPTPPALTRRIPFVPPGWVTVGLTPGKQVNDWPTEDYNLNFWTKKSPTLRTPLENLLFHLQLQMIIVKCCLQALLMLFLNIVFQLYTAFTWIVMTILRSLLMMVPMMSHKKAPEYLPVYVMVFCLVTVQNAPKMFWILLECCWFWHAQ